MLGINNGEPGNTTGVAGLDCTSLILSSPIQGAPKGNVKYLPFLTGREKYFQSLGFVPRMQCMLTLGNLSDHLRPEDLTTEGEFNLGNHCVYPCSGCSEKNDGLQLFLPNSQLHSKEFRTNLVQ